MRALPASSPILLSHPQNGLPPFHLAEAQVIYDLVLNDTTTPVGAEIGGRDGEKHIPDAAFWCNYIIYTLAHPHLLNFYLARQ